MQLYDDIGPITNEEFEAEPKPEAVEEKEKMEEEDVNGKELVAEEPQQQEKNQEQITGKRQTGVLLKNTNNFFF